MELPTQAEVQAFQKRVQRDPEFFVTEVLKNNLWEKEREILLSVRDNTVTAVRSCHASGKSYTAARVVVWWLTAFTDSVVITTAPTFRQVKEILWREIKGCVHNKHIFPASALLETQINIGPNWFALGLSSDKSEQFQGFHSPHLLAIVDEASGVSEEIYQAIDGLAPERILMIGNPLQNSGTFADSFKQQKVNKIHISALDTPNLIAGARVIPGLVSPEDVERMRIKYGEESDVYRVRVLGEFPLQDSASLIAVDDVHKAIERTVHVLPQFEKKLGVDVARFGDDRSVLVIRQMEKVLEKQTYSSIDTMQIAGHVLRTAKDNGIKAQNIYVDAIGVGGGVIDRLREQGWRVNGIQVSEKAQDSEHYLNLRTELYVKLRDWLKTADIPNDDDFYELANVQYKFNSKGQLQLESKDDMKKRGLPSPDVADALMLTFAGVNTIHYIPQQSPAPSVYYNELGI